MSLDDTADSSDSSEEESLASYRRSPRMLVTELPRLAKTEKPEHDGHTVAELPCDAQCGTVVRAPMPTFRHSLARISTLLIRENAPLATEIEHELVTTSILRKSNSCEGLSPHEIEMLSAPNPPLPSRSVPVPLQHLKSPAYYHSRSSYLNPENVAYHSALPSSSLAANNTAWDAVSISSESSSNPVDSCKDGSCCRCTPLGTAIPNSPTKNTTFPNALKSSPIDASVAKKFHTKHDSTESGVQPPIRGNRKQSMSASSTASSCSIMSLDAAVAPPVSRRLSTCAVPPIVSSPFRATKSCAKRKNSDDVAVRYDPIKRLQRISVSPTGARLYSPAVTCAIQISCSTCALPPPALGTAFFAQSPKLTLPSKATTFALNTGLAEGSLSTDKGPAPMATVPLIAESLDQATGPPAVLENSAVAKQAKPSTSPSFGQLLNIQGAKDHLSNLKLI